MRLIFYFIAYQPHMYGNVGAEDVLPYHAAKGAGNAAITDACPLINNRYKIQIAKTLVKRAILACK